MIHRRSIVGVAPPTLLRPELLAHSGAFSPAGRRTLVETAVGSSVTRTALVCVLLLAAAGGAAIIL
jgi:hypothetical protein